MHWLVLPVPRDQHAQQLELLFSGRTRSAHLSHFHKDNTTKFELFVMVVVVTPSMRLYLPRVEARLRGVTALKAMSQVR